MGSGSCEKRARSVAMRSCPAASEPNTQLSANVVASRVSFALVLMDNALPLILQFAGQNSGPHRGFEIHVAVLIRVQIQKFLVRIERLIFLAQLIVT